MKKFAAILLFCSSSIFASGNIIHLPPEGKYIEPNLEVISALEKLVRTLPKIGVAMMARSFEDPDMVNEYIKLTKKYLHTIFDPKLKVVDRPTTYLIDEEPHKWDNRAMFFIDWTSKEQRELTEKYKNLKKRHVAFIIYKASMMDAKIFEKKNPKGSKGYFFQFNDLAIKKFGVMTLPTVIYGTKSGKTMMNSGSLSINDE